MTPPKIVTISPRLLVGLDTEHTLSKSKAKQLWSEFMPQRKAIGNTIDENLYSVQFYGKGLKVENFTPNTLFKTCACVAVADFNNIPEGLNSYTIEGGLYAVFIHKGGVPTFEKTSNYIFNIWLPDSVYELDDRVHFELLGEKFIEPLNPESEEEVWIPIRDTGDD